MRKIIFILFIALSYLPGLSQTYPPGLITSSVTWTKEKSPYIINQLTTISSSAILTIEKGTTILFVEEGQLLVYGIFIAKGTREDSIRFESDYDPNSFLGPQSIILNKGSRLNFDYCVALNHYHFIEAVNVQDSSIFISNSSFKNITFCFEGPGIELNISACNFTNNRSVCISRMKVNISNTYFENNPKALVGPTGTIRNSVFNKNSGAILEATSLDLEDNKITNNAIGLQFQSESKNATILNNIFEGNTTGILIDGNSPTNLNVSNNDFRNLINVENDLNFTFNFSGNCWGTTDTTKIMASIRNKYSGKILYQPLHPRCRSCKPEPFTLQDTICSNTGFKISTKVAPDYAYESYLWSPSEYVKSSDSASVSGQIANNTNSILTRKFMLTMSNPVCIDSSFVTISVFPDNDKHCRKCNAFAGNDLVICGGTDQVLGIASGMSFDQFKWIPGDGLNYDTLETPFLHAENITQATIHKTYRLIVSDSAAGCSAQDTILVTILPEFSADCKGLPPLHAYNVITPNGDGLNETFTIDFIEFYHDNEVSVYNRWGNRVLHQKNYKNDWNGNHLPDGIYYYIITLPDDDQPIKGDLTIEN